MKCCCIEKVNAYIAEKYEGLRLPIDEAETDHEYPSLMLIKPDVDTEPLMHAMQFCFCPFCGKEAIESS